MPTPTPDTFATRLRSLMTQAGLSAPALALASGIGEKNIYRLLSGGRPSPSLETAQRLAHGLGVSVAAFDGITFPRLTTPPLCPA